MVKTFLFFKDTSGNSCHQCDPWKYLELEAKKTPEYLGKKLIKIKQLDGI